MTTIEVYGRGVSFSLTEITPELAKELTEIGITEERYEDLEVNELEDTDEDECGITSGLEVHVDGQKIASPYQGALWDRTCKGGAFVPAWGARQMLLRENDGGEWALANKRDRRSL